MSAKTIGQFIFELRKENGMTQQEVADRLNVSNKAVSRWERDACAPDISVIPALAELYGVTCDELLKGERAQKEESSKRENIEVPMQKQTENLLSQMLLRFKKYIVTTSTITLAGFLLMFVLRTILIGNIYNHREVAYGVAFGLGLVATFIWALAIVNIRHVKSRNELWDGVSLEQKRKFESEAAIWSYFSLIGIVGMLLIAYPFVKVYIWDRYRIEELVWSEVSAIVFLTFAAKKFKSLFWKWMAPNIERKKQGTIDLIKCNDELKFLYVEYALYALGIFVALVNGFLMPYNNPSISSSVFVFAAICCIFELVTILIIIVIWVVFLIRLIKHKKELLWVGLRPIAFLPTYFCVVILHDYVNGFRYWNTWDDGRTLLVGIVCSLIIEIVFHVTRALIHCKREKSK